jgi:cell division protein FtsW
MTALLATALGGALKAVRRPRAAKGEAVPLPPVRDWINVGSGQPTRLLGFDQTLVCVVIALLAFGVVMVYSASVALPDSPKFARYVPTYFMSRQIFFVFGSRSGRRSRRGSSSVRCCC